MANRYHLPTTVRFTDDDTDKLRVLMTAWDLESAGQTIRRAIRLTYDAHLKSQAGQIAADAAAPASPRQRAIWRLLRLLEARSAEDVELVADVAARVLEARRS